MKKLLALLLGTMGIIAIAQLSTEQALADIGPSPVNSQGGILQPSASSTNVSMDYEKVVLTYSNPEKISNDLGDNGLGMRVHVKAQFKMKNSGIAETMKVYFPSDDDVFAQGNGGNYITNFTVNGTKLPDDLIDVPAGFTTTAAQKGTDEQTIKAYQWQQTFAPGETVLNIEYDSQSSKAYEVYYLTYVIGTGRNWAGTIGSGEIDFVMPQSMPEYAVTGEAPMVKKNKFSYTVSGKTIKVKFSNYEPAADDVIVLGVSNLDTVKEIEALKKKDQNFANTLEIAGLFRKLSVGAHCYLCTAPASDQAEAYYNKALDKAKTRDDMNTALRSYAFGDVTGDFQTLESLFASFTYFAGHQKCDMNDSVCVEKEYSLSQETPFGMNYSNREDVGHAAFLARYACRIRPYDTATASLVEAYAGQRLESCAVKEEASGSTQKTDSQDQTVNKKSNRTTILQIAGGVAIVIAAAVVLWAVKKHRHNTLSKRTEKPSIDKPEEK
ncbi:MAG TPA: hypothetical protein VF809_01125 [Candidatus Saccharimonadales bacterium]